MNIQSANANEYLLCARAINLILLPGHKSVPIVTLTAFWCLLLLDLVEFNFRDMITHFKS